MRTPTFATPCAPYATRFRENIGVSSIGAEPIPKSSCALTKAGVLSALIPEEFGGSGLLLSAVAAILEEIHHNGCNGAACHAQMYIMGTLLRHGSDAQERQYLPKIAAGELRLQAFGVTEPTSGTDTTSIKTFARREREHYVVSG